MKWSAFAVATEVQRGVPIILATVAGFVDACTFFGLFGLFVAQVTGSYVVAGTHAAIGWPEATVLLAIPAFIAGGIAATIVAVAAQANGKSALAWVFGLESLTLIGFIAAFAAGAPHAGEASPLAITASLFGLAAMGEQSASVRLLMRGVASTNVMTTNTSQITIEMTQLAIARLFRGRGAGPDEASKEEDCRRRLGRDLPLPLAFLAGTVVGALAYDRAGFWVIAAPVAAVGALTLWAARTASLSPRG
jgi:uncharacterized membrane protein YoaK (UPF0700 family)